MPLLAPGFDDQPQLMDLTIGLTRVMFPIVLLLALSGVIVGMLNPSATSASLRSRRSRGTS